MRFLIFILIAAMLLACASDPKYRVQRPMLFEIKKGNQHKGYLFGTIHRGVDADDMPEAFWPIFDSAEHIVTEIDTDLKSIDSEMATKIFVRSEDQFPVKSQFEPKRFQVILEIFRKEYKDKAEFILDYLNLLGVSGYLTKYYFGKQDVVGAPRGEIARFDFKFMLDKSLQDRAKKHGRIMTYLDQNIVHVIFQCLAQDEKAQVKYIEDLMDGKISAQNYFDEYLALLKLYREGNADFDSVLNQRIARDIETDKCILEMRNEHWLSKITQSLEAYDNTFIAVGAAHLNVGPKSLIPLLQEAGFTIIRVPWK